jgi:lysyl-tRNA synthetase class 2
MAKKKDGNPDRAERLELYIDGVELANGCTEKTDVNEQLASLQHERDARAAMKKEVYPWPDAFAAALPDMPACAGMALGIDRLVMLLCGADELTDVIAFPEH